MFSVPLAAVAPSELSAVSDSASGADGGSQIHRRKKSPGSLLGSAVAEGRSNLG